jgi:NADH-quinone oxidoreductase subunit G
MPMGFKTGAGVIFGTTGGVSEAVLRNAYEQLTQTRLETPDFTEVRGNTGILRKTLRIGEVYLKLAIVNGLANAKIIAEQVKTGGCDYDLIEVMACPGGCVAGAGQPVCDNSDAVAKRAGGLYETDKTLQLHKSQENPYVQQCYQTTLEKPGSHKAHDLLHTHYQSRKRLCGSAITLSEGTPENKLPVSVCVGTGCYLRGSQTLLTQLMNQARTKGIEDKLHIRATFCFEACSKGPTVKIGDTVLEKCNLKMAQQEIENQLAVNIK